MSCPKFTLAQAKRIMPRLRLPKGLSAKDFLVGLNEEREHSDLVGCHILPIGMVAARHFRSKKNYYRLLLKYVE